MGGSTPEGLGRTSLGRPHVADVPGAAASMADAAAPSGMKLPGSRLGHVRKCPLSGRSLGRLDAHQDDPDSSTAACRCWYSQSRSGDRGISAPRRCLRLRGRIANRRLGESFGMAPEYWSDTRISRSGPRVLIVLRQVVEDLIPGSFRADEHVRHRLERGLVDQ